MVAGGRQAIPSKISPIEDLAELKGICRRSIGLLGVALSAEPRDLAVSVHPLVGIGLAGKACDFSLFTTWIVCLDCPVVICNPDDLEGHFCFRHGALCSQWPQAQASKRQSVKASKRPSVEGVQRTPLQHAAKRMLGNLMWGFRDFG